MLEIRPALSPRAISSAAEILAALDRPVYAVREDDGVVLTDAPGSRSIVASAPPLPVDRFGARSFREAHGVRAAYVAGAMAGGIGSVDVVAAMSDAGLIGGFGAGGLALEAIEAGIVAIKSRLGASERYKINLLHAPLDPELEQATVDLYLRHEVRRVSASGFMDLTAPLVLYRARGLQVSPSGRTIARNHVLAKVSRPEVAEAMMRPAPQDILQRLVAAGRLDPQQATLAAQVPIAEDITAEGDSGGHTDRQPTIPLWTTLAALRDRIVAEQHYDRPIRVGCAGGIGTPSMVLAAFVAGADYVLTGSINQACVEAATSGLVKAMLARVDIGGVEMAPAADMFELGVKVQVLKQGTLFVGRAERLARTFQSYAGWDAIPAEERAQLEKQVFRRPVGEVWAETEAYLSARAPRLLEEARRSEKRRLALLCRWYLAMGSRWAVEGNAERKADFQVWCSAAMAAFNAWARGTALEPPENRRVAVVADRLLEGAAVLFRGRQLALQGIELPAVALGPRTIQEEAR